MFWHLYTPTSSVADQEQGSGAFFDRSGIWDLTGNQFFSPSSFCGCWIWDLGWEFGKTLQRCNFILPKLQILKLYPLATLKQF
jgi:hypothetical protein